MRKRLQVFGRGDIAFIESSNSKVLCFARNYNKQSIIVVANLSQFSQATTLDLKTFKDCDITEVFSQNKFNSVTDGDYSITIGPYGYFWFQADASEKKETPGTTNQQFLFESDLSWERLFGNYTDVRDLERKVLPSFMKKCRWFGGKARAISKMSIHKAIPLKVEGDMHFLTIIEVHYVQRLPELYFLPMCFVPTDSIMDKIEYTAQSVIGKAEIQGKPGFILDSSYDKSFRDFLFTGMDRKVRIKDDEGTLEFNSSVFSKLDSQLVDSKILKADQSNTAIIYNDKYFFKFYRKIEQEINPELEIVRFLSENTSFRNAPKYSGSIEYRDNDGNITVLGLLQEKVDNQGDSWVMTIDSVGRFYERVMAKAKKEKIPKLINKASIKFEDAPELIQEFIGRGFYERVVRLGQRTAEMHIALASGKTNPAFAPETFTANYQRSLYSTLRKLTRDRFKLLEQSMDTLNIETQELAKKVLAMEDKVLECFSEIFKTPITALKTRIHGDYHLGQVLFTGKDFIIIDFEGEPGFSFSERRLKKNPMKDVAGMMRSFHYAAFGKIMLNENYREKDIEFLEEWAEQWQHYVSRFYLGAYMEGMGMATTLSEQDEVLIRTYLIEKAIYELGYELNGRPDWVNIPLRGIYYHMNRYFLAKEEQKKKN